MRPVRPPGRFRLQNALCRSLRPQRTPAGVPNGLAGTSLTRGSDPEETMSEQGHYAIVERYMRAIPSDFDTLAELHHPGAMAR